MDIGEECVITTLRVRLLMSHADNLGIMEVIYVTSIRMHIAKTF